MIPDFLSWPKGNGGNGVSNGSGHARYFQPYFHKIHRISTTLPSAYPYLPLRIPEGPVSYHGVRISLTHELLQNILPEGTFRKRGAGGEAFVVLMLPQIGMSFSQHMATGRDGISESVTCIGTCSWLLGTCPSFPVNKSVARYCYCYLVSWRLLGQVATAMQRT